MDVNALPTIVERKRTLRGLEKTFSCRVLERAPGALTVLFVSDRPYEVGGLSLPAGTITFGHFWQDPPYRNRPYNVYHWLRSEGPTIAHYFNLVEETVIGTDELTYLDLTVDVLLRPGAPPAVLDADELPPTLPPAQRARVSAALALTLADATTAAAALERQADHLWRRLFGGDRR